MQALAVAKTGIATHRVSYPRRLDCTPTRRTTGGTVFPSPGRVIDIEPILPAPEALKPHFNGMSMRSTAIAAYRQAMINPAGDIIHTAVIDTYI